MMQILLKTTTVFIVLIMMLLASCTSDVCYECLGFDGGSVGEQDTLICADQFDSRAAFDDQVEIYEALGGICNEQ